MQTSQGGSILGFIVGGILFIFLFLGGVYVIRHQTGSSVAAPSRPTPSQPQPRPEPAPAAPKQEEQPSRSQPSQPASQSVPPQTPSSGSSSVHLPQTGASASLVPAVAVGLLSGAAIAYLRSRRISSL